MKCQDVRLAIDIASRREPINSSASIHLSGCPDCRHYADKTDALLQLISAQPRVQVPADFDFKLRARIARAQSEQRKPAAFLDRLWGRTFSWSHVAAATATVAVAAALTTFQFIHNESSPSIRGEIATSSAPLVAVGAAPTTTEPVASTPSALVATRTSIRPAVARIIPKAPSTIDKSTVNETDRSDIAKAVGHKAIDEPSWRGYIPASKQFVSAPSGNLFGAEGSNLRSTKDIAGSF